MLADFWQAGDWHSLLGLELDRGSGRRILWRPRDDHLPGVCPDGGDSHKPPLVRPTDERDFHMLLSIALCGSLFDDSTLDELFPPAASAAAWAERAGREEAVATLKANSDREPALHGARSKSAAFAQAP